MKTLQTSFFWSNNLFKLIETFLVFINPSKKLCITFVSLKTIASLGRIKLIICLNLIVLKSFSTMTSFDSSRGFAGRVAIRSSGIFNLNHLVTFCDNL